MSLWAARGRLYLTLQSIVVAVGSILGMDKDFSRKRLGHFWGISNFYSEGDEGCYGGVGAV